jgi:outer membrane receptor protein involved in Fe transport
MTNSLWRCARVGLMASAASVAVSGAAWAQTKTFNIPAQPASQAVAAFARQADVQVLLSGEAAAGRTTNALRGAYSVDEGLRRLLARTGLTANATGPGTYVVVEEARAVSEVEAPAEVEEILVTANKRAERLQDVPISITATTGRDLARRGASGIEDIVSATPGLYNAGAGEGVGNNLVIRGISTGVAVGLKQAPVSLLLDDIELNPGSTAMHNANPRIVDVERVEVLRGPQGTLFGSGSLSGAVRFIANKPDFAGFGASLEATGQTTRYGDNGYSLVGVVNAPIVEDKAAVRVAAYDFDAGGWVDNAVLGERNVNSARTTGGRLMLALRSLEDLSVNVTALTERVHQMGASSSFYYPQPGMTDYERKQDRYSGDNDTTLKSQIYNLTLSYRTDWGTLTSSSNYFDRSTNRNNDYGFWVSYISLLTGAPLGPASAPSRTWNAIEDFAQEIRFESAPGGPLKWTLGAFYQKLDVGGGQYIGSNAVTPVLGTPLIGGLLSSSKQTETAIFGAVSYTLAERLDLTAGVRVGQNKLDFVTRSNGVLFTGAASVAIDTIGRQKDDTVNPRFALTFRQTPDLTWYGQISKGFRSGGPNLTAGLAGGAIPTSYGSDSLWNYEVGSKARLLDGRVQLNTALYYIDWSNLQVGLMANATAYTGNAGGAKVYGLETELAARPLDWLEVGGSLSVSHSELTRSVPNLSRVTGAVGVHAGERLPAAPELQASAYAEVAFDLLDRRTYLRVSHQYVGGAYTDFGEKGLKFGNYGVTDLRLTMEFDRLEAALFVDNLFDGAGKTAATDVQAIGPVVGYPDLAFRVRPRTVGLTLRARY